MDADQLFDREEEMRVIKEAVLSGLHIALPVRVTKDGDGKTTSVQPTITRRQIMPDGTTKEVQYPVMEGLNRFMSGGGITGTHPIKKDDEGMVIMTSRSFWNWREQGGTQAQVDARSHDLSDAIYVSGIRSKPRDLQDYNTEAAETRSDDGKHRTISHPKNGVKVTVNGGKQTLDVNAISGALEMVSKTVTLKAGMTLPGAPVNTANTTDRDLNEQLKGLAARVAQTEQHVAGLFDVTSRFRAIVQTQIPAVAAVASILNQDPSGLMMAATAIEGKAQAYLQQQMQQALAKFLSPNLAGLASLLSGGVEGLIANVQAQIANLVANNPVLATVDDLQRQVDAILIRGAAPDVTAAALKPIQDQIAQLTEANPVVGTLLNLNSQLQALTTQAGPGLNFLGPQQRLVQGVVKSLHLSEG